MGAVALPTPVPPMFLSSSPSSLLRLLLIPCLFSTLVRAVPRNVSYDDTDPGFSYRFNESWATANDGANGSHRVTSNVNALATFKFTGIALYFMTGMWSIPVGTDLSIKSSSGVSSSLSLDLQDPLQNTGPERTTRESAIVAYFTDLGNTEWELEVKVGQLRPFAVVDQIIVTVDDDVEPPAALTPKATSLVKSDDPSASSSADESKPTDGSQNGADEKKKGLSTGAAAAVGAVGAVLGLLLIGLLVWFLRKKRRNTRGEKGQSIDLADSHSPTPYHIVSDPQNHTYHPASINNSVSTGGQTVFMKQRDHEQGYVPHSPNQFSTASDSRYTYISDTSGSGLTSHSGAAQQQLRLVNEESDAGPALPPNYEATFGAGSSNPPIPAGRSEKAVLRARQDNENNL